MYRAPMTLPPRLVRRIPKQLPKPDPIHSSQAEIYWTAVSSDAQIAAWLTGPPSHPCGSLTVDDTHQILPYTTLEFTFKSGGTPFAADTPYQCNLFSSTGQSNAQVRDRFVTQINAYAATWGRLFPDMRSLRAIPTDPVMPGEKSLRIFLPWGMLGAASFTLDGPLSTSVIVGANIGIDNPLFYSILGKRRHVFGIRNPYRPDYYGDQPIG
jgi:hypothetical protein